MSRPDNYGARYWAITGDGDTLYLYADTLEVLPSGALVAWGGYRSVKDKEPEVKLPVYCIAKGHWHTFFAASCIDGSMVASDQAE